MRRLRPARPGPGRASVPALRRTDRAVGRHLPRLRTAALVHDGALRALARRPHARRGRALEARRDLTCATGRGVRRPRAAASACRGDRGRAGGARPAAGARGRPARGARRGARTLVGSAGRAARAPHARRAAEARSGRGLPPAQRARCLCRSCRALLGGARRRRVHHGCHGRRVRPGDAASGCRAGSRDHTRAYAPRSVLCESAAPWQTPGYDVPERGGT